MTNIYLDNAATTQIAGEVLDAMVRFEKEGRGNPYRGLHSFAERSTFALQDARKAVGDFIHASDEEIIFTKSATEGLNLAMFNLTKGLGPGDEVVHTIFDHHATLLPLLEAQKKRGFTLKTIGGLTQGSASTSFLKTAQEMIGPKTKLIVAPHVSNVLGTILPIKELVELSRAVNAKVLIDGAQAVGHIPVDVLEIGCDAYAFSAHKMYGPMGIGALYVRKEVMDGWEPMFYGGGMVEEVERLAVGGWGLRYLEGHRRFEAGTPDVTGAIGFAAACKYLSQMGREKMQKAESELTEYLLKRLEEMPTLHISPSAPERTGVVSFTIDNVHPHDVAQVLADRSIAVRAGNHCAAPLAKVINESGTVRVSLGIKNTKEDIDALLEALKYVRDLS